MSTPSEPPTPPAGPPGQPPVPPGPPAGPPAGPPGPPQGPPLPGPPPPGPPPKPIAGSPAAGIWIGIAIAVVMSVGTAALMLTGIAPVGTPLGTGLTWVYVLVVIGAFVLLAAARWRWIAAGILIGVAAIWIVLFGACIALIAGLSASTSG